MNFKLTELPAVAVMVLENAADRVSDEHATVLAFSGDLGAGKTTLIKEMGKQLGVSEGMQSPTFVIYKIYETVSPVFRQLIHGDMYRLEQGSDIEKLGWNELLADPENLICIEWPEKIADVIPEYAVRVTLGHVDEETRSIDIL